ncbi:M61 family metallopeptidase [Lysobacter sp. F60174L2]|uniref:M61 family metallopeptidase n=1 Tax=Lysobacter sp. F60174L2 TaxID=3459295 RepID=UPI00403DB83D
MLPLSIALAQSPATTSTPGAAVSPQGALVDSAYPGTMVLTVDATDVARRVLHVRQQIPVSAGQLTLLFPKWIPGKHRPDGPINKLAGLEVSANGQPLAWKRDPLDVYAFKLEVPAGVSSLDVRFDMLTPTAGNEGRVVMTHDMLNVQWGTVALYPSGYQAGNIAVTPSLVLPSGWQAGTALELQQRQGDTLRYGTVSFEVLQDSPVYAGRHFKRVDLDPGADTPVMLDIVADAPKYLEYDEEQIEAHRALVDQAYKLFDSKHYDHYDFLLSLSDRMGGQGLEHHRSSENGVKPGYFSDWDSSVAARDLLPHEFVHSWNGKFRRPAGLATPNFHVPMDGSLLWVYEGQTQYWGMVLAARSGLWDKDDALGALALVASTYATDRPGLDWRNVQDTTYDPVISARRPQPYRSYQMSEDYYNAGALVWLAVDAKLRELSNGRRSLDDFASAFFGVDDGSWEVKPYVFEDVVAALNGVEQHDWATFLRSRLDANAPPLDGLAASGWKLVYRDEPSDYHKGVLSSRKAADYTASLGMVVSKKNGEAGSVRWDGPAFNAGIAPGSTLLAVNGYAFDTGLLDEAIKAAKADGTPIELVVKHGEVVKTVTLDYRGGLKYPHLERIEGSKDRLGGILQPL